LSAATSIIGGDPDQFIDHAGDAHSTHGARALQHFHGHVVARRRT
jgi:hypothetical protein